jgi:hypothetical protein
MSLLIFHIFLAYIALQNNRTLEQVLLESLQLQNFAHHHVGIICNRKLKMTMGKWNILAWCSYKVSRKSIHLKNLRNTQAWW